MALSVRPGDLAGVDPQRALAAAEQLGWASSGPGRARAARWWTLFVAGGGREGRYEFALGADECESFRRFTTELVWALGFIDEPPHEWEDLFGSLECAESLGASDSSNATDMVDATGSITVIGSCRACDACRASDASHASNASNASNSVDSNEAGVSRGASAPSSASGDVTDLRNARFASFAELSQAAAAANALLEANYTARMGLAKSIEAQLARRKKTYMSRQKRASTLSERRRADWLEAKKAVPRRRRLDGVSD